MKILKVLFVSLLLLAAPLAFAADVTKNWLQGPGGFYNPADRSGPYSIDANGVAKLLNSPASGGGDSTFTQASVSCASTATLMLAADTTKNVRQFWNGSAVTVYFGPVSVTTSTGQPVAAGSGWDLSRFAGAAYCIVATGTASITTMQY
jgi:hypothetical protein